MIVWDAFIRELVEHYVAMASTELARDYAFHQVKDLARQYPSEFGELPKLCAAAMKGKTDAAKHP